MVISSDFFSIPKSKMKTENKEKCNGERFKLIEILRKSGEREELIKVVKRTDYKKLKSENNKVYISGKSLVKEKSEKTKKNSWKKVKTEVKSFQQPQEL